MKRWSARGAALLLLVLSACSTSPAVGSNVAGVSTAATSSVSSGDFVQDKNFYLLTLLQSHPLASKSLRDNHALQAIGARHSERLRTAYRTCVASTRCLVEAGVLPVDDQAAIGEELARLAAPGGPLNTLVREQMRPSRRFARHEGLEDGGYMKAAWTETAEGLNRLFRVYGLGERPRYPDIDSASHEIESAGYRTLVRSVLETWMDAASSEDLVFEGWMRVGLDLLAINQRDEAARYEPLEAGANAAALARARKLDWSDWSYSAILVPGAGTLPGERGLSAAGLLRVRLAARRYEAGLAPLIIVSGGHVHPDKTPYAEAVEMKRELMQRHKVPEAAILIDPHARHTTTNLRNAVRLIHQAGAPADALFLITSSRDQSAYIEGPVFAKRNRDELRYEPARIVSRLGPHDLVADPNLHSLHLDPLDPLDP